MFITVIGLIAAGMFAYSNIYEEKDIVAKDAYDTFFDIRLKTDDMFDETDARTVKMCDLVAAYMITGEGDVLQYIESVMSTAVSPIHSYTFKFEYRGYVLTVGPGGDVITSRYASEMKISDGRTMKASLTVY
jgi:hypothetical protein